MKNTAFALVLIGGTALGLAGCAEIEKAEDFLTNPKTVQAVATLKAGASAFICSVADAALVAQQVEAAIQAGQSVQGTDGKLYVSSAIVCASLGGTVTGSGVVQ
jgi:hypothetical protein